MSVRPMERELGTHFQLDVPPDLAKLPDVRSWVHELAQNAKLGAARAFDLQVVVSEAVANAIEHADSGVEVAAWLLPDRLIVEITNDGAFMPGLYKDDDGRRRGLGLPLMVSLADQVHVARLSDFRTQVSLTFFVADRVVSDQPEDTVPEEPHARLKSVAFKWLPLPLGLLIVATAILQLLQINGIRESALILTACNTLFLTASSLTIAYLAARDYLVEGRLSLILLVTAASLFGLGNLMGGLLDNNANQAVVVQNSAIFLAGLFFFFSGANSLLARGNESLPGKFLHLGAAFVASAGAVAGLTLLGRFGLLPTFYTPQAGFTAFGDLILALASVFMLASSLCYLLINRRQYSPFVLLSAAGFAMVGISLTSQLLTHAQTGSAIDWIARGGQWIGGLYLFVAVLASQKSGRGMLPVEKSLYELEGRYRNLVDTSLDAIIVESGNVCAFANPAAAKLLGFTSPHEVVGRDIRDVVAPQDVKLCLEKIDQVYSGGVASTTEETFIRQDHSTLLADVTRTRVRFGGHLAVQTVMRDITNRKRAEEALRESEERFRLALKNAPVLLAAQDLNLRYIWYYSTILQDLEGKTDYDLFPDKEAERVAALKQEAIDGNKEVHERLWLTQPEGKMFLDLYFEPLRSETGAIVGITSTCFDLTTHKRGVEALRESRKRYRRLAQENERLYHQQLNIAESLQLALLNIPSEIGRVRLGYLYRSATETAQIGGDFYDVFEVKNGNIAVLIGDVAGHGIEAARTATLVRDVVHAFTHQSIRTHEVMRRTNKLLVEKELPGFVSLFLGILDVETGTLHYSSAGHPTTMLRRSSGEILFLGSGSSPLGVYEDKSWKPGEVEMTEGDLLLLYTDGVIEARREGELFGEKRLEKILRRRRVSVKRLPQLILDQVLTFSGGVLKDDLAVLALSLAAPPETLAPPGKMSFKQESLLN